ncbi:hypothetical protein A1Q1_04108 [Trichosporon asahii var. asahii CBS 2479]|uniref:Alpha-ketoglutarate-dependent dioxygenase AlkB-like domain-containing protein n=1 Tax=Trichosporon asahii var. asahii (strain ATCC 90039 / CBS 2479 / JCM 2466 / KCTC 7840 / NBRC 103889/ NCYC 2677 / UAMH 7654) TaxID=1186058 RepID=J4U952_TRIAS|nr:hypothetical protein A1Q1_04108 [Trichosporon asahii var. asahii CBS 2479]EJT47115.1 hypothetical protein A1Q1_04108 [Trichosporon asahii var. asahii CBS 2479]
MRHEERDAALASLIHVLEPATYPLEDYDAALDRANNDVSRAAELLLLGLGEGSGSSQGSKGRKRQRGIDFFMKPKPSLTSSPNSKRAKGSSTSRDPTPPEAPPEPFPEIDREAQKGAWSSLLKSSAPKPRLASGSEPLKLPPLRLGTPAAIKASGIPVAMLQSPLSPQFAAQLYHVMMAESPKWNYNKFFLNGRECMSNHSSSTYSRTPKVFGIWRDYVLSGAPVEYFKMPPELEKAALLVEDAVNEYLDSVPRYPLEWRGRWRANMCGANRYEGAAATVGFHADQLTNLGPYPTIASLSLGVPRAFRVRPSASELDSGPLDNSVSEADPSIPPQKAIDIYRPQWDREGNPVPPEKQETYTSRINITFRFYRDGKLLLHPEADTQTSSQNARPNVNAICPCASLRADQKGKVRAAHGIRPTSVSTVNGRQIVDDGMVFFWQCQGSRAGKTECNTFKILDINAEGRGPCMRDPGPDFEPDEEQQPVKKEIDVKNEPMVKSEAEAGRADEHVSDRPNNTLASLRLQS